MSNLQRFKDLEKTLRRAQSAMELLGLNGHHEQLQVAIERFDTLEACAKQLAAALQPGVGPTKRLEGPELWRSLVEAVVSLAKDKTACRLTAPELKNLVVNYAPERDMSFWNEQLPGHIVGLLGNQAEVRTGIELQGVLFWTDWRDREWRLVDSQHLTAHADIRRYVMQDWPGGRRCRFCSMEESMHVNQLQSVELEKRTGMNLVGDVVVLPRGQITHEQCRMPWVNWLEIAYRYPTQEAAEEADRAAGRTPRAAPVQKPKALPAPATKGRHSKVDTDD